MTNDFSDADRDTDFRETAPTAWDAIAAARRRLALRAWRDWPEDLPSQIAPSSVSPPDGE